MYSKNFESVDPLCNLVVQVSLIQEGRGDEVVQETRSWDEGKQATASMRSKEGLADYRYFPEPDLPPLRVTEVDLEDVRVRTLPTPWTLQAARRSAAASLRLPGMQACNMRRGLCALF